jgi:signal transduction histidine kinase
MAGVRAILAGQRARSELQRQAHAEEERLERVVAQRTAQLIELAHHLQIAREDERSRLARDLHDELGSLLTSAKLDAARIRSRLAGTAPEALERLAHLVSTLDSVIALKRRITEDLMPSSLNHLGLVPTLEILAREFSEASAVPVQCSLQPVQPRPRPSSRSTGWCRSAQHRQARPRGLCLAGIRPHESMVEVSVRDDGVGYDETSRAGPAYGLVGMRFRVEAEHGTLSVSSRPGQGTLVRARLPTGPAG